MYDIFLFLIVLQLIVSLLLLLLVVFCTLTRYFSSSPRSCAFSSLYITLCVEFFLLFLCLLFYFPLSIVLYRSLLETATARIAILHEVNYPHKLKILLIHHRRKAKSVPTLSSFTAYF